MRYLSERIYGHQFKKSYPAGAFLGGWVMPEENLNFQVLYGGICDHSAAMTVNSTIQFL